MPREVDSDGNDQPTNSDSEALDRHAEYYFDFTIFLVENELFKVPRRNFAIESEVFSDMFQLPPPTDGTPPDGSSDDRPIRLDGIKKSDFIQLLRVIFPIDSQSCDLMSSEEWASVLKLSTMWEFKNIRTRAIKALENPTLSMDLVDKIVIARNFNVSSWLVPSLNALVQREKSLNLSEGNRLGLEWALKVAGLRERPSSPYLVCPTCSYSGPTVCNICHGAANRCGSAVCRQLVYAGVASRASIDYCDKIRKIFELQ